MPSLQHSLHFCGLPGTAVPGFHMPPLRGSAVDDIKAVALQLDAGPALSGCQVPRFAVAAAVAEVDQRGIVTGSMNEDTQKSCVRLGRKKVDRGAPVAEMRGYISHRASTSTMSCVRGIFSWAA